MNAKRNYKWVLKESTQQGISYPYIMVGGREAIFKMVARDNKNNRVSTIAIASGFGTNFRFDLMHQVDYREIMGVLLGWL